MIKPNDQIGPYTLIRQLGKGGFGVVWLAERRSKLATTQVAVKIILDQEPDLDAIGKESQVWVKVVGHPNVLSIIEANVYDEHVVIVSEYVPDGSLDVLLKGKKEISLLESINLTIGILSGLEHLHSQRIIHRDLKPANILLNKSVPRLADFGLARVMKSSQNSGSVAGTPAYMAPEAFDGKRFVQSDIWSVGVILYQLVSKQMPFPQTDMTALVGAIITRDPQPLPGKVPISIQKIILKALEKNPAKRFQSAIEMRLELEKIYSELGIITLKNEAMTMHMSQKAFTPANLSELSLQNDTSRNKLDTNTGQKLVVNTFDNENVPKTSRVIQPISTIPPTVVIKPKTINWKSYIAVVFLAIAFPGGYFYFQSQNNQILATDNQVNNTAKVVIENGLTQNTSTASLTNISNVSSSETKTSNSKKNINEEELNWQNTRNSTNQKDYENFIKQYPNGIYTASAQAQLKELIRLQNSNQDRTVESKMNVSTNQTTPVLDDNSQTIRGIMRASNGEEREVLGSNNRQLANQNNYPQNQNNYSPEPQNKLVNNPKNVGRLGITGKWQQQGGDCNGSIFFFQENGNSVSVTGNATCTAYGNFPISVPNTKVGYDDVGYEINHPDGQVYQVKIRFDPDKKSATKYCRARKNPKQEDVSRLIRIN